MEVRSKANIYIIMVKNTGGGNKNKKGARKNMTNHRISTNLRVVTDEGELYAVVLKLLGGGMFHAQCSDGELRLGHIRGKFTGRRKRDNEILRGTWVLVGMREWNIPKEQDIGSSSTGKSSKKVKLAECDLLEIYNDLDKDRLKNLPDIKWGNLDINTESKLGGIGPTNDDDIFKFSTGDANVEMEQFLENIRSGTSKPIGLIQTNNDDGEEEDQENDIIDIDDI